MGFMGQKKFGDGRKYFWFQVRFRGLVHRFVNNYINRAGCGFECTGLKTQA